jgi:hypothetical protein
MDDTRLYGERSGYWREDHHQGRQWLFTKAGLQQACKGFDFKQVVDVLKVSGWLLLDSEGKSAIRVNIKNNVTGKNRFFCIVPNYDGCSYEKTGGTSGTGGTVNQMFTESTTCTTDEKQGGTAEPHAFTGCTTEKTDNATQAPDRGRI